jgi:membrane associated rhomboid family serine protease
MLAVFAFLVVNFLIAFAAPVVTDAAGIAWEAHLGGFAAGLLLLGAFDLGRRVDATL